MASSPVPGARRSGDLSQVRALVVDENAAARQAMKELLGASGIGQVQQAADPVRAIRMIEAEPFGLVLCESKFRTQMDGLQVLEYVRTRRLLAASSAFVLVSAEADRGLVAAAREWQPDGFVLKPLTAATLAPRIEQALRRRAALAPVYEAAERGDAPAVLARATRLAARSPDGPTLELMRWQVQALVDLGRFEPARELAERALERREDLPWAELAIAHAEHAEGLSEAACERLRSTIRAHPMFGGAYDLLIDILQRQGRTAKALAVAQSALEQIATSRRTRTLGELAFAHGELEMAEKCYSDLLRKTSASLTRSALDVGMLGQVFVGQGASDKALRLVSGSDAEAGDVASQALAASVQAQAHAARGDGREAREAALRAIALAEEADPGESVTLLVARGAFKAGLREQAEALVRRAVLEQSPGGAPGALARKVLDDAGIAPDAFVAKARGQAQPAPPGRAAAAGGGDAVPQVEARAVGTPRAADDDPGRARYMQARARADDSDATRRPGARDRVETTVPASPGGRPRAEAGAPSEVGTALSMVQSARFDDAVRHVERALRREPRNPSVLLAAVQVHLLRMRTHGYDEGAAQAVRDCLAELDRQIPGERRVLEALHPTETL